MPAGVATAQAGIGIIAVPSGNRISMATGRIGITAMDAAVAMAMGMEEVAEAIAIDAM